MNHLRKNISSGLPILIVIGFALWIFKTLFATMDKAIQEIFWSFIGLFISIDIDPGFPTLGIILAIFPIAYLIGLLMRIDIVRKIILGTLQHIPLVGGTTRAIVEVFSGNLGASPIVEIEFPSPGRYQKAWLVDVSLQKVKMLDGSTEEFISYTCFIPTSNNPTSGQNPRLEPHLILYVFDNSSAQLLLHIVTFGKMGNQWNRREFNTEEFYPTESNNP